MTNSKFKVGDVVIIDNKLGIDQDVSKRAILVYKSHHNGRYHWRIELSNGEESEPWGEHEFILDKNYSIVNIINRLDDEI